MPSCNGEAFHVEIPVDAPLGINGFFENTSHDEAIKGLKRDSWSEMTYRIDRVLGKNYLSKQV
jgi:hypothetical protein